MSYNYGSKEYWDERYSRETEPFEWYQTYQGIRPFFTSKYLNHANQPFDDKENTNEGGDKVSEATSSFSSLACSFPDKTTCRTLILGCGSSCVGEELLKDGWVGGITQLDFSPIVIEQMKKRYDDDFYAKVERRLKRMKAKEAPEPKAAGAKGLRPSSNNDANDDMEKKPAARKLSPVKPAPKSSSKASTSSSSVPTTPKMKFECADVKSLPFEAKSFDLIICKGTLDSILCSTSPIDSVKKMMKECNRVLDKNGVMVVISHGSPENRMVYFEEAWSGFSVQYVPKPRIGSALEKHDKTGFHYIYICYATPVSKA